MGRQDFGTTRIYYNNFASHLLNTYNPNMLYPEFGLRWGKDDWRRVMGMVSDFGFNAVEFWLVPRLFCREGLDSDYGRYFLDQIRLFLHFAHENSLQTIMLCSLSTSGSDWRTLCPNTPDDWRETRYLWRAWCELLPELDTVSIFPGDPGACSLNGCTAETFIDRSADVAGLVKTILPWAEIEFHTWGPPFFGWGILEGPAGWNGEFVQEYQDTAWVYSQDRAERSMKHLLKRLPDFPDATTVAINLAFNSDGRPDGEADAIEWAREIAETRAIRTWDFSLTEGENAIVPHYRFKRLFDQRRSERSAAPYSGGICFTMSPMLNQLSLYESAQSFINPDADPAVLAEEFYEKLFGAEGRKIVAYLPLFEVVKDWGNYETVDLPRLEYHRLMYEFADLLQDLDGSESVTSSYHPDVASYRRELLDYARLFTDLSAGSPDYDGLRDRYWRKIYAIYDSLPEHVDPRPVNATSNLIQTFRSWD